MESNNSPNGQLKDLGQSVVQHVGLGEMGSTEPVSMVSLHWKKSMLLRSPGGYLGLAVSRDLLKRSLLELLDHLTPLLPLLLLQACGVCNQSETLIWCLDQSECFST